MQEVIPGVVRWTARHPKIGMDVHSHLVLASGTVIDPLLPPEGIDALSGRDIKRVVLSCRHHLRDSEQVAAEFGCPILAHESGLHEFEGGPAVAGFAFGDELAEDVTALEMGAIAPDDTVLRIDQGGGALLFADAVINYGNPGFVPDSLIGDDPEGVKEQVRERTRDLLSEPFEHLLFAHGEPRLGDGRDALREFATG
jgi:glyoxylase-like metal-dependent hydrolase (beta-lactamase superfamily II)